MFLLMCEDTSYGGTSNSHVEIAIWGSDHNRFDSRDLGTISAIVATEIYECERSLGESMWMYGA